MRGLWAKEKCEKVKEIERMVVVHVKAAAAAPESEADQQQQFLYECRSASAIDEVADAILGIHALQSRVQSLSLLLRQRLLANPSFAESYPDAVLALERSLSEAETYASKDQVACKKFLSAHTLRVHIKSIEKEAMTAQSKGFLDFDLPQPPSDFEFRQGMQLWWAGKELVRGKRLCDYIGANEKTKIAITLKPASSSP